jgi:isoquinoline 1-oxidoreductase subunit beta
MIATSLDRREFFVGSMCAGTALLVGAAASAAPAGAAAPVEIGPWIVIHADDSVVVRVGKSEIGQGVLTSNAMMICEELECDWSKVRAEFVDVNRDLRENKLYDSLRTTAATSALDCRGPLQKVGAIARERLKTAAAARWGVPVSEVAAKNSILTHRPSGRTLRYGEVAGDAAAVVLGSTPAAKSPDQFTLLGTRVSRLDTAAKARGEPIFGIDVRLPGMVYASVRLRPSLGSSLESYNFDAVRHLPGVIEAVPLRGVGGHDGIAIVADTWWRAETALKKMPISWRPNKQAPQSSQAFLSEAVALLQSKGVALVERGHVAAAERVKSVTAVYATPMQTHAQMETVNCTAQLSKGRLDVWVGSQAPDEALRRAAKAAGMSTDDVYLQTCYLGGGFGGRTPRGEIEQAVVIAKQLGGRPVKLVWPREEEMRNDSYHPFGVTACRASLDDAGGLNALEFSKAGDVTGEPSSIGPLKAMVNSQNARSIYDLPYASASAQVDVHDMRTGAPVGIWRSVGDYHNVFAIESFIDEVAHAAGADAYRYRRSLLERSAFWNRAYWIEALDRLAASANWGRSLPRGTGLGLAISDHRRPGRMDSSICAVAVQVTVPNNGALRIDRVHIVYESGLGLLNPLVVEQQLRGQVAWSLGSLWQEVRLVDGQIHPANFDDYPMVRMADYPKEVTIDYLPTGRWNQGVGEMLVPMLPPAVCNAIFNAIGKRMRSLPLRRSDLVWS